MCMAAQKGHLDSIFNIGVLWLQACNHRRQAVTVCTAPLAKGGAAGPSHLPEDTRLRSPDVCSACAQCVLPCPPLYRGVAWPSLTCARPSTASQSQLSSRTRTRRRAPSAHLGLTPPTCTLPHPTTRTLQPPSPPSLHAPLHPTLHPPRPRESRPSASPHPTPTPAPCGSCMWGGWPCAGWVCVRTARPRSSSSSMRPSKAAWCACSCRPAKPSLRPHAPSLRHSAPSLRHSAPGAIAHVHRTGGTRRRQHAAGGTALSARRTRRSRSGAGPQDPATAHGPFQPLPTP